MCTRGHSKRISCNRRAHLDRDDRINGACLRRVAMWHRVTWATDTPPRDAAPPARLPSESHVVAAPPGPGSSHDRPPPPFPHLPSPPRLCSHSSVRSTPLQRRFQQQAGATPLGTGEPFSQPQRCLVICTDLLWTVPVVE
jgi:hypothetical protein